MNENKVLEFPNTKGGATPEVASEIAKTAVDEIGTPNTSTTDALIEAIATMNCLEATEMKKNIEHERDQMQKAKELIEAINQESLSGLNKSIVEKNILNDAEYKKDAEDFLNQYDQNMEDYARIIATLDHKIAEYDDVDKTSRFYTEQALEMFAKRREIMMNGNPSNITVAQFDNTVEGFKHREDYSYLRRKSQLTPTILKIKKRIASNPEKALAEMTKTFDSVFNKQHFAIIHSYVLEQFNGDSVVTGLFMCHLAHMYANELKYGYSSRIKILGMNILDATTGILDICDGDKEKSVNELNAFLKDMHQIYSNI